MVAQIGKNLTEERFKILGEFWAADISAEILHNDNPKVPKQIQHALDTGIPLILWIGEDEVAKGIVKIKSLNYHTEEFVPRENMIERVKELILLNPVLLSQAKQEELKKDDSTKDEWTYFNNVKI